MANWKQAPARVQLDLAAKWAERDIVRWQLRSPMMANPLDALVMLAVRTADVMKGGSAQIAEDDLLTLMHTLASNSTYAPSSKRWPFTQEQMRRALVAKLTPAPAPYAHRLPASPAPHVQRRTR